jgi:ABC-2 type transport system permease protein
MRTWILVVLMLIAIILVAVVLRTHQHADPNWKQTLTTQTSQLQQSLQKKNSHLPASTVAQLKQEIQVNQYDIAHNIDPNHTTGWKFASTAENLSALLVAFIVVIAGDVVASEFSSGTIKMLLTQTATRTKILTAKYLAAMLFGLFMTAVMFVGSLLIGWIFFGASGATQPQVYVDANSHLQHMGTAAYLLMQYGFLLIQVVIIITIAFMISAIFRSSTLAIMISILAFLVGSTLVSALSSYAWVKYILFSYTNLTQFVVGGPQIHGLTLGFAITMLVLYFIVMNFLSWLVFVKRDVSYS